MKRDLLLTIITITKDDAPGLARTLVSAEAWRTEEWVEQIVVDASGSPAIVGDARILFMRQSSTGIAGAYNEGLAQARGKWVWFLNGGDEIDERLKPQWLEPLMRDSQAQVIIGGITHASQDVLRPHMPTNQQWPSVVPWIPHPSTLVARTLFERFGLYDRRYCIVMDYEWWLRALAGSVMVDVLSMPFVRFAPGGVSQRADCRERLVRERDDVIRRYQPRLWYSWLVAGYRLLRVSIRSFFTRRMENKI